MKSAKDMSAVELFNELYGYSDSQTSKLHVRGVNHAPKQIPGLIEAAKSLWYVESANGEYVTCPTKATAIKKMAEMVGNGFRVDLYGPDGGWVASSDGIKICNDFYY